ncbi:hypothetical protein BpHYR1_046193 [Brachionus plicatilis]|uniref:Uncharacterized protein n=1 Tax=Brachionus plicatilis TaxID=10195 RepID=A0A3M7Q4B7_BRAPC|nr:hypothetical protein BpHYR1_046193 [Brachionus plicatilis]
MTITLKTAVLFLCRFQTKHRFKTVSKEKNRIKLIRQNNCFQFSEINKIRYDFRTSILFQILKNA